MKKSELKPAEPVATTCNVITQNQISRLYDLLYLTDSVKKLLDRSERLEECECEAQCFIDIEGPKIILGDTLEKFTKLLYAIENNPNASWPEDEDMDLLEMAFKESGAQ